MSHIPSSAMPHAHANGDTIDDQPPQPAGQRPEADPATATPMTSQAPATATGNREGSEADRTARSAGEPSATAATSGQPAVDGTITAQDGARDKPNRNRTGLRSPAGIAALAVGGLAIAGGIAAALFPRDRADAKPKRKKRQRKKG